jgi:hypothetical protein
MTGWTNEATEYLEGYLKQVALLARHQGDDADDIVNGLRDHIEQEVKNATDGNVDLQILLSVLDTIGSPQEVAALDFSTGHVPNTEPIPQSSSLATETIGNKTSIRNWSLFGKFAMALIFAGVLILVGSFLIQLVYPKGPGVGNPVPMGVPDIVREQIINTPSERE